MGILEGKVAIITGGGQGIGEGLVYAFCHEGAKVVNIGRTFSKVEVVVNRIKAEGCEALALQCDISDYAQVEAAVAKTIETYGKVDVLVNNAMTQRLCSFEETTQQEMYIDRLHKNHWGKTLIDEMNTWRVDATATEIEGFDD